MAPGVETRFVTQLESLHTNTLDRQGGKLTPDICQMLVSVDHGLLCVSWDHLTVIWKYTLVLKIHLVVKIATGAGKFKN